MVIPNTEMGCHSVKFGVITVEILLKAKSADCPMGLCSLSNCRQLRVSNFWFSTVRHSASRWSMNWLDTDVKGFWCVEVIRDAMEVKLGIPNWKPLYQPQEVPAAGGPVIGCRSGGIGHMNSHPKWTPSLNITQLRHGCSKVPGRWRAPTQPANPWKGLRSKWFSD